MCIRARLMLLMCCVLSLAAAPSRADDVRLFIMAGQSNMVGDEGMDELVFDGYDYSQPQSDIFYDYHIDGIPRPGGFGPLEPHFGVVPDSSYGSELSFGRKHADTRPVQRTAIFKVAVGGANLAGRWNADIQGDLYDLMVAEVTDATTDLQSDGHTVTIAGFGWVHGDGDMWVPDHANAYHDNLVNLVTSLRTDLGAPAMHALVSQTPITHNKPADMVAILRQAKIDFVAGDPHASLIDTDDLSFRDENIHFDGTSRLVIGVRMGDAYLDATRCPADMNNDGTLNTADILAFIAAFIAAQPAADFNSDGIHNIQDITLFLDHYIAGC